MNYFFSFSDAHFAYGTLTLTLTVLPALVAATIKRSDFKKQLFLHLPIIQLKTHQEKLRDLADYQNQMLNLQTKTKSRIKNEDFEQLNKNIEDCQQQIGAIKTELQAFKVYAGMLESAPQVILQLSILMKKVYFDGEEDPGGHLNDPLVILQILTSLISVVLTTSGLMAEMPFIVGRKKRIPYRSLGFTYGLIVPLVTIAVTPRLISVAATFSFATLEDWCFYAIFALGYLSIFIIAYVFGPVKWMKKKMLKDNFVTKDFQELISLGFFTSFISPCIIGQFHSKFLIWTSALSTILQTCALTFLWIIAHFYPDLVFNSEGIIDQKDILEKYCVIIIPTLFITWSVFPLIHKLILYKNKFFVPIHAIDYGNKEMLKKVIERKSVSFTSVIPGDRSRRTIFLYALTENDEFGALLVKHHKDLGLVLNLMHTVGDRLRIIFKQLHTSVAEKKTPLMLSSFLSHIETVHALFQEAQNGVDVALNYVDRIYEYKNTAFHLACLIPGPLKKKKQVIELFWTQARILKIDLIQLNAENKTGIDILNENVETAGWVHEFSQQLGNPLEEFNFLKETIDLNDNDKFNELMDQTKFSITPELVLVYAIKEKKETFALALIENYQKFNLQFDFKPIDEFKKIQTVLMRSCEHVLPSIVNALLEKSPQKNLAINAVAIDNQEFMGSTAFHYACRALEKGASSIEEVKQVLEPFWIYGKQSAIDFTINDRQGNTGLVYLRNNVQTASLIWQLSEKHDFYPLSQGTTSILQAIDSNDMYLFKSTINQFNFDVNQVLPGLKETALHDALKNNETFALTLIENSSELKIDLNQKSSGDLTVLMKCCELAKLELVKALFDKSEEVNFNGFNDTIEGLNQTAFHFACLSSTGNVQDTKDIIDLFLSNSETLEIDLEVKDYLKKTGFQYVSDDLKLHSI